jgi:hypothetical protein
MRRPESAFAEESVNGASQLWQVLLADRSNDVEIDAGEIVEAAGTFGKRSRSHGVVEPSRTQAGRAWQPCLTMDGCDTEAVELLRARARILQRVL